MRLKATLRLENGLEFHGYSLGSTKAVGGEVVFNTSMAGYPEQLTDAAYQEHTQEGRTLAADVHKTKVFTALLLGDDFA